MMPDSLTRHPSITPGTLPFPVFSGGTCSAGSSGTDVAGSSGADASGAPGVTGAVPSGTETSGSSGTVAAGASGIYTVLFSGSAGNTDGTTGIMNSFVTEMIGFNIISFTVDKAVPLHPASISAS